eukprot:4692462-Alexandrium_andersonii.AAC.1
MSASLVGSEMCIRDSPTRLRPTASGRRLPAAPCAIALPNIVLPHSAKPVSYTHLTLPTICSV